MNTNETQTRADGFDPQSGYDPKLRSQLRQSADLLVEKGHAYRPAISVVTSQAPRFNKAGGAPVTARDFNWIFSKIGQLRP
jgi:hypothetical protein